MRQIKTYQIETNLGSSKSLVVDSERYRSPLISDIKSKLPLEIGLILNKDLIVVTSSGELKTKLEAGEKYQYLGDLGDKMKFNLQVINPYTAEAMYISNKCASCSKEHNSSDT